MGLSDAAPPAWAPLRLAPRRRARGVSLASPPPPPLPRSPPPPRSTPRQPAPPPRGARARASRGSSQPSTPARASRACLRRTRTPTGRKGPRCHRVFWTSVRDARGGASVFSRGSASERRAESNSVLSAVPSIAVPSIAVPSIVSSTEYAPPRLYAPTHSVTYRAAVFSSHRFASRSAFTVRIFVAHPRAVSSSTRSNTRSTSASYAARARAARALERVPALGEVPHHPRGVARRRRHREDGTLARERPPPEKTNDRHTRRGPGGG